MPDKRDIRFFPVFIAATMGILLEMIATIIDEVMVGYVFDDDVFASVNLIEPYIAFEIFTAYLICVGSAALIVRAQGGGDSKRMGELFSQTIILCAICSVSLTAVYVLFTPQLVRLVADDPAVCENALAYFKAIRFYPLLDMPDTFIFTYVLYRGGYKQFYIAIFSRIVVNALLSWQLGLRMGVMGVGMASILSLLVALMIKLTFLLTKKHGLRFGWYLNPREVFYIAGLGFPESALFMYQVVMELGINTFTLKKYGAAGVAAVSVAVNFFEVILYLSEGISEFESVAVNESIGRGSSKSMDCAIKLTRRAALIEGAVLACGIFLLANVLPEVFNIDNDETAHLAAAMLRILAPAAVFICLSRITAIFYQYTRRIPRTLILFGMCVALFPVLFGMLLGQIAPLGIAVGMAAGPMAAFALMYVYVRFIKKEELFDYTLMQLD